MGHQCAILKYEHLTNGNALTDSQPSIYSGSPGTSLCNPHLTNVNALTDSQPSIYSGSPGTRVCRASNETRWTFWNLLGKKQKNIDHQVWKRILELLTIIFLSKFKI